MRITDHPILAFPEKKRVTFYFEDQVLEGYEGEPIAAALHDADIKVLQYSIKSHRPRGFFCAIGNCSSCLMEVNGESNVRVCTEKLKAGMRVRRQRGRGALRPIAP